MKSAIVHLWSTRWSLVLILLIGFYLLVMLRYDLWNYGGVSRMKPLFADTHIVLAAAECNQKGYDVYRENPCDDLNRPHCYSRLWFIIGQTGLNTLHTNFVGGVVIAVFLFLSIMIVRPRDFREFFLFSILIFSPSIMLGVERANMDLLIFSLVAICGYLLVSKIRLLRYLAYPLLLLNSFLKFYPISSFGIFIYHFKKRKNFWLLAVAMAIIFGLFLWMTHADLVQLKNNIPRPNGWLSFGVSSLVGTIANGKIIVFSTLIVTCVIFLFGYVLSRKAPINLQVSSFLNVTFFILGSFNLFFCFFLNTNYDYRTIFYLFVIPYLYESLRSKYIFKRSRRMIYIFIGALAASLWFNFFRYALEFIGKTYVSPDLAENMIWAFFVLKQIGSWISITILLAINIELIEKPLKEKLWAPAIFQRIKN